MGMSKTVPISAPLPETSSLPTQLNLHVEHLTMRCNVGRSIHLSHFIQSAAPHQACFCPALPNVVKVVTNVPSFGSWMVFPSGTVVFILKNYVDENALIAELMRIIHLSESV